MKQSFYWISGVLIFACLASGCSSDAENPTITIPFVEQEFILDLWENLDPAEGPALQVNMATIANEECLNTTILSGLANTNQKITITLFDILNPENCQIGEAPATGQQTVNNIENERTYIFNIELQNVVTNTGQLIVTPAYYEIQMPPATGISWAHKLLRRIPQNVLWGFITYSTASEFQQAQAWVEELASISESIDLPSGYYGYFSLDDATPSIDIVGVPTGSEFIPFIYAYDGDLSTLDESVTQLEENLPEGMVYRLWDDNGNVW